MKHKIMNLAFISITALTSVVTSTQGMAKELSLEEVVVTAQRRSESLQDVPIAVTAVDSEAMEIARVEDITNFSALTPSVKFTKTNNPASSSNVIIRGVGTVGNTRSFEGAVGVFYDDVYRSRAGAAVESFLDIENVQILKGPQGTLFGKNTTAGAILLQSAEPIMEDGVTGKYNIGFGNFDSMKLTSALNIGVNDTNALRIAALYKDGDGHYTDVNTGDDLNSRETKAVKVQWKSDLSDKLGAHLIVDSLESEGDCCYGTSDFISGAATRLADALALARGLQLPSTNPGDREASLNRFATVKNTDDGITLKVNYDSDMGELKSVTAYREYSVDQRGADADFNPIDILGLDETFESEFFSQEFTFNLDVGESGDLLLGAFYSKEDIKIDRNVYNGPDMDVLFDTLLSATSPTFVPALFNATEGFYRSEAMDSEVESKAIFAHLTYDLSDNITGIAGIRYSEDEKTGRVTNPEYNPPAVGIDTFTLLGLTPRADFEDTFTDEAVSGVLGLQYKFDNAMAYLTFNRGYKSGGVILDTAGAGGATANPALAGLFARLGIPTTAPVEPLYDSETTDSLELGLKTNYWDGRAQTNVAGFYNKIEDLQIAQFVGLQFTVLNAQEAETYGLEIENTFLLAENFTLTADLNWLPHAEYADDPTIDPDLSGERMIQAPEVVANLGFSYETELTDNFALAINGQYQYSGERRTQSSGGLIEDDSYDLLGGSISLISTNGWQVDLWGQNLTDEDYVVTSFNTPFISGEKAAYLGSPRTYGLNLRGEF